MVVWEATEEEASIKLDERTIERLQSTTSMCCDKGWKVLDPSEIEAGEVLRVGEL